MKSCDVVVAYLLLVAFIARVDSARIRAPRTQGASGNLSNPSPSPAEELLDKLHEFTAKLHSMDTRKKLYMSYEGIITDNADVLNNAINFANAANRLGIPVGYSVQPSMGYFWELVNKVACQFHVGVGDASNASLGTDSLSSGLRRVFPEGAEDMLQNHGFVGFQDATLMRSRSELEKKHVLALGAKYVQKDDRVPEYVDWLNIDDLTGRHSEPVRDYHYAFEYNEVWTSASANMMQVGKMESALYFLKRSLDGGGSPIFYEAMRGSEGMNVAINLGKMFASSIIGPDGDYPVPESVYDSLSSDLAKLWIELARDQRAKILHVILIAPSSASRFAYISQAFGWLSEAMVNPKVRPQLKNMMRLTSAHLIGNDELVEELIGLNQNAAKKFNDGDDLQMRIRPYTRSLPNFEEDPPGTAPFVFFQNEEDKAVFQQWHQKITELFQASTRSWLASKANK